MVKPVVKIIAEDAAGKEICEFVNAQNISFTRFLSSIGELVFTIPHDDPKYLLLSGMKSHLKVVRDGAVVWKGVYDYYRETPNTYTIFASTYESLLKYYLVTPTTPAASTVRKFVAKKMGTEVAKVLFDEAVAKTGSLLTGFTDGTIENPYTPGTTTEITSDFEFNYDVLWDAFRQLMTSGGMDFEITTTKALNIYRRKGTNQAAAVFQYNALEPSNITDFKRDVDFRAIGNDLSVFGVGVGANFLRGNTSDATSKTAYGLMERNLGMPKVAVDQDALDKVVADQIQVTKDPLQTISPNIITKGVGFLSGWDLGDNVKIVIALDSTSIDAYKRAVGVQVAYSKIGAESVYLYLGAVKA